MELTNFIEFTIYRAVGGGERKFIKPQTHEMISTVKQDYASEKPKKGVLSFLGFFSRILS